MMIKESLRTPGCFFKTKYLITALLCMLLISCASSDKHRHEVRGAGHDRTVNGQEYNEAGHHIVAALSSGNAEVFNKAIHKKTLLDRTFQDMPRDSHIVTKARASLDPVLDQAGIIMTRNLRENTQLTFVRSRFVKGEHRALVRVNMGDRGLSYIDFVLGKDEESRVKIIDWHDYAQGQLYSDSLRQALVLMLPHDKTLTAQLFGGATIDKKSAGQFSELARLSKGKNYTQWMENYNDLPEKLKYSRTILVTRALIASAMGSDSEYRRALKDVNTYYGDDPTLSLMLIDHYFNERDYRAAHRALDRLHEYTGGDAAIDFLRANICLAEKNYHQSTKYAQIAIRQDSTFENAYLTLLIGSVYSKQFEITVNTLEHLEFNFGYEFEPDEIARLGGYEEFSRSFIFAAWKADRMSLTGR